MILINKILTQQNLDNTYSFSNELDYLVHLGKYIFYFKFIFILFLFILNIYLLFYSDESLNDSSLQQDYNQSIIARLNRIFKEYSSLFVGIGSVYAASLNSQTAKSQKEREELKLETSQKIDRFKELPSCP